MNKNKALDWAPRRALDWAAIGVVAVTIGGVVLSMALNWQFTTFFLIPLLAMVVGIGWTIGWALARCYRLLGSLDRSEAARSGLAKVAGITAVVLIVASPVAKALDDNLQGGYAGIYTHLAPTMSVYWGNFIRQFQYAWDVNERHSNYDGR